MKYILDTNAVIYFLEDVVTSFTGITDDDEAFISFVTRIELFTGKLDEEKIFMMTRFLKECSEFAIDEDIIQRSIFVRKKYCLKTPDAIIVATAIEKNLILITADKEIIKKVDEIEIINPLK